MSIVRTKINNLVDDKGETIVISGRQHRLCLIHRHAYKASVLVFEKEGDTILLQAESHETNDGEANVIYLGTKSKEDIATLITQLQQFIGE